MLGKARRSQSGDSQEPPSLSGDDTSKKRKTPPSQQKPVKKATVASSRVGSSSDRCDERPNGVHVGVSTVHVNGKGQHKGPVQDSKAAEHGASSLRHTAKVKREALQADEHGSGSPNGKGKRKAPVPTSQAAEQTKPTGKGKRKAPVSTSQATEQGTPTGKGGKRKAGGKPKQEEPGVAGASNRENNGEAEESERSHPDQEEFESSGSADSHSFNRVMSLISRLKELLGDDKTYPEQTPLLLQAVQNARDDLERSLEGRGTIIVGHNGIGKTFLINLILMLTAVDNLAYASPEFWNKRRVCEKDKARAKQLVGEKKYSSYRLVEYKPQAEKLKTATRRRDNPSASMLESLKNYCRGDGFDPGVRDGHYLLPSMQAGGDSTTRIVTTVEFGYTWGFLVGFASQDWAKEAAYEYIHYLKKVDDIREAAHDENFKQAKARFNRIVSSKTMERIKQYEQACQRAPKGVAPSKLLPSSRDEIELHEDLVEVCGELLHFRGAGQDFLEDRLFITDRISRLFGCHSECAEGSREKEKASRIVTVMDLRLAFAPCRAVANNGRLSDSPGIGTTDALQLQSLYESLATHETVIAVPNMGRSLAQDSGLVALLFDQSEVISNMVKYPQTHRLIVMHYLEKILFSEHVDQLVQWEFEKTDKLMKQLHTASTQTVREELLARGLCDEESADRLLLQNVAVISPLPVLFASVHMNLGFQSQAVADGHDLSKLLQFTQGYELLGLSEFAGHQTCFAVCTELLASVDKAVAVLENKKDDEALSEASESQLRSFKSQTRRGGDRDVTIIDPAKKAFEKASKRALQGVWDAVDKFLESPEYSVQWLRRSQKAAREAWSKHKLSLNHKNVGLLSSTHKGKHPSLPLYKIAFKGMLDNVPDVAPLFKDLKDYLRGPFVDILGEAVRDQLKTIFLDDGDDGGDDDDDDDPVIGRLIERYVESEVKAVLMCRVDSGDRFFKAKRGGAHLISILMKKLLNTALADSMATFLDDLELDDRSVKEIGKEIKEQLPGLIQTAVAAHREAVKREFGSTISQLSNDLNKERNYKGNPAALLNNFFKFSAFAVSRCSNRSKVDPLVASLRGWQDSLRSWMDSTHSMRGMKNFAETGGPGTVQILQDIGRDKAMHLPMQMLLMAIDMNLETRPPSLCVAAMKRLEVDKFDVVPGKDCSDFVLEDGVTETAMLQLTQRLASEGLSIVTPPSDDDIDDDERVVGSLFAALAHQFSGSFQDPSFEARVRTTTAFKSLLEHSTKKRREEFKRHHKGVDLVEWVADVTNPVNPGNLLLAKYAAMTFEKHVAVWIPGCEKAWLLPAGPSKDFKTHIRDCGLSQVEAYHIVVTGVDANGQPNAFAPVIPVQAPGSGQTPDGSTADMHRVTRQRSRSLPLERRPVLVLDTNILMEDPLRMSTTSRTAHVLDHLLRATAGRVRLHVPEHSILELDRLKKCKLGEKRRKARAGSLFLDMALKDFPDALTFETPATYERLFYATVGQAMFDDRLILASTMELKKECAQLALATSDRNLRFLSKASRVVPLDFPTICRWLRDTQGRSADTVAARLTDLITREEAELPRSRGFLPSKS